MESGGFPFALHGVPHERVCFGMGMKIKMYRDTFFEKVLGPVRETFPFGSYEKVTPGNPTNYTGQEISCGTGTFSIGNSHYTSKIKVSPISPGRDMSSEFLERTLDGKSCWEKQLGMLRWAARNLIGLTLHMICLLFSQ